MDEKIDTSTVDSKKGGFNIKILLIGLPLFIIQLVVVYFITANFLLSSITPSEEEADNHSEKKPKKAKVKKHSDEEASAGNFFFTVDDVIINPAGTNGQRLMLASVGFDVETEEEAKVLKEREVLVKDIIISTLSSKTLTELSQVGFKDSLKNELSTILTEKMPDLAINNVYFSKYILQ